MGILLHKMKQFSPFVKKHFRASPQFISLAFFLTCLLIELPYLNILKVSSLGDYYYIDSNGAKQTNTLYFAISSDFTKTFFGQILTGFSTFFLNLFVTLLVGIILNISSYIKYKSHVINNLRMKLPAYTQPLNQVYALKTRNYLVWNTLSATGNYRDLISNIINSFKLKFAS